MLDKLKYIVGISCYGSNYVDGEILIIAIFLKVREMKEFFSCELGYWGKKL